MQNYYEGKPEDFGMSFSDIQNRDRTKPASIQQMNSIANNPDYNRLSVSRDFGSGAPVVISDFKLNEQTLGRIDTVSASDGTKIPVQYAVIEAETITPSNRADGSTVQSYADPEFSGIRPVAGNGRVAGLQRAYKEGKAQDYSQNLIDDTAHGINPNVIKQIENPVLIRIMPKSALTSDIADKSNVGGQLGMSPTEQAKIDMGRFDLQGIEFLTDGAPSIRSLRQFVATMPKEEQAELINRSGQPNPLAKIRLSNALFARAYENDALIDLFAETTDPEAQQILRGMAIAAPAMSNLSEAGDYDIRSYVTKAAEMAVNARRQNKDLVEFIEQGDIELDPLTREIVSMFATNKNAPRRVGDSLTTLAAEANKAAEQANAEPDMFGNVAVSTPLEDVFAVLRSEPTTKAPVVEEEKPAVEEPEVQERVPFVINKSVQQIAKEVEGMSIPQLSQWMIDNAPNKAAKAIAEAIHNRIKEYEKLGVSMTLEILKGSKRKKDSQGASQYSLTKLGTSFVLRLNAPPSTAINGSYVDNITGTEYRTIMHEMLHVVTQAQLFLLPKTDSRVQELENLLYIVEQQIKKDIAANKDHPMIATFKNQGKKWGPRKNIREIIAWGLTDPNYQNYLSTIKVGDQTVFSKFVDVLRKLLGLKEQYQTALEKVAYITEELVNEDVSKTQKLAESVGGKLGLSSPSQIFNDKTEVGSKSTINERLEEKWQRLVDGPVKTKPKGFDHVPDDYWNGINPIFYPQGKNIFKKMDDMRPTFWKRLAQGIADQ
ncbi:MAG: hypothetical protein NTW61_03065, partial [Candidatus Melainabacteria bacterium]|nr:hypothetical protein [Candidatus Melainabacteria bacterium]